MRLLKSIHDNRYFTLEELETVHFLDTQCEKHKLDDITLSTEVMG